jgi:hypothetical protein
MRNYLLSWWQDVTYSAPDALTVWAMQRRSRGPIAWATIPLAAAWMERCMLTTWDEREANPHLWRHWPRRVYLLRRERLSA